MIMNSTHKQMRHPGDASCKKVPPHASPISPIYLNSLKNNRLKLDDYEFHSRTDGVTPAPGPGPQPPAPAPGPGPWPRPVRCSLATPAFMWDNGNMIGTAILGTMVLLWAPGASAAQTGAKSPQPSKVLADYSAAMENLAQSASRPWSRSWYRH